MRGNVTDKNSMDRIVTNGVIPAIEVVLKEEDETVDNLLLENSYYGDFKIKSVHSTTCRTFNPDKEEDILALVITKRRNNEKSIKRVN